METVAFISKRASRPIVQCNSNYLLYARAKLHAINSSAARSFIQFVSLSAFLCMRALSICYNFSGIAFCKLTHAHYFLAWYIKRIPESRTVRLHLIHFEPENKDAICVRCACVCAWARLPCNIGNMNRMKD